MGGSQPHRAAAWAVAYVALAAATVAAAVGYAVNGYPGYDYWEHVAVVRELATHPWQPRHPILDLIAAHAFESPYALVWALVSRLGGMSATATLTLAGVANLALFFGGLRALLRRTSKAPSAAALLALPLILFWWGRDPWLWSGFFHLEALLATASYPSTFAAALVLWSAALASSGALGASSLASIAVLSALAWTAHPVTGVVLAMSVAVGSFSAARGSSREILRSVAAASVVAAAGCALACLWPYFSLFDLLTSPANVVFDEGGSAALYVAVPQRIWPILLLAPLVIARLHRDRRDALALLALGASLLYALSIGTREGLGRTISWAAVYVQLAAAETLAAAIVARWPQRSTLPAGAIVAVTLAAAWTQADAIAKALPGHAVDVGQGVLTGTIEDGDVVLGDLETIAPVPGHGGRVVAWRAPLYWIADHDERRRDVATFLADGTSTEERRRILRQWNVEWILLDQRVRRPGRYWDVAVLAKRHGNHALMRIRPDEQREDEKR